MVDLPAICVGTIDAANKAANKNNNHGIDNATLPFPQKFVVSSVKIAKDLHALVEELATQSSKAASNAGRRMSTSRKLRPHTMSIGQGPVGLPSSGGALSQTVSVNLISPLKSSSSAGSLYDNQISPMKGSGGGGGGVNGEGTLDTFQSSLVDLFFHQHQELQSICEFIVDRVVRYVCSVVVDNCIVPSVSQSVKMYTAGAAPLEKVNPPSPAFDLGEYMKLLEKIGASSCSSASAILKAECSARISKSLMLLAPRNCSEQVLEIATDLSTTHATTEGNKLIRGIVRTEAKKCLDKHIATAIKQQKERGGGADKPAAAAAASGGSAGVREETGEGERIARWLRGHRGEAMGELGETGDVDVANINEALVELFQQRWTTSGDCAASDFWRVLDIAFMVTPAVGSETGHSWWLDDLFVTPGRLEGLILDWLVEGGQGKDGGGRKFGLWLRKVIKRSGSVVWHCTEFCETALLGLLRTQEAASQGARDVVVQIVDGLVADDEVVEEGDEMLFWRLKLRDNVM
jgi:hypothetical protein